MPLYDLKCTSCDHEMIDCYLKIDERPPCPQCGSPTETLWRTCSNVIGDDIPGGLEMRHLLCADDGSPQKFYSKSEIIKAAKAKGYSIHDEHVAPPGTDKAKFTKRWF